MTIKHTWTAAAAAAVLVTSSFAPAALGAPVLVSAGHLTHRFGPGGAGGTPTGDFVEVNAALDTTTASDPPANVSVLATQGTTTIPVPFFPFTAPINSANIASYVTFISFDASLLGAWSIVASDSGGTGAPILSPPITNPEFVPLVTGIAISDTSTTPTLSWTVPDLTGFDVEFTQIRIIEVGTDLHTFFFNLAGTPSSFTIPAGEIELGKSYVFRVGLLDQEGNFTENRSDAFSEVFQAVPAPMPLVLLALGLISLPVARRLRK